jgi:hypothetical protein
MSGLNRVSKPNLKAVSENPGPQQENEYAWQMRLLAWFLVVGSVVIAERWWLPLSPVWRVVSLTLVFFTSLFLMADHYLKNFDIKRLFSSNTPDDKKSTDDPLHIGHMRRDIMAMALGLVAYLIAVYSACYKISTVNELYMYIAGWAVLCLILDFHGRLLIMAKLIDKNRKE